jgi:hypothetical protein
LGGRGTTLDGSLLLTRRREESLDALDGASLVLVLGAARPDGESTLDGAPMEYSGPDVQGLVPVSAGEMEALSGDLLGERDAEEGAVVAFGDEAGSALGAGAAAAAAAALLCLLRLGLGALLRSAGAASTGCSAASEELATGSAGADLPASAVSAAWRCGGARRGAMASGVRRAQRRGPREGRAWRRRLAADVVVDRQTGWGVGADDGVEGRSTDSAPPTGHRCWRASTEALLSCCAGWERPSLPACLHPPRTRRAPQRRAAASPSGCDNKGIAAPEWIPPAGAAPGQRHIHHGNSTRPGK